MADTTNRVSGTAYLTVDGTSYPLVGELQYCVSSVTRETVVGQDTVHGYKEKPHPGYISGTFRDTAGLTVANINSMTNVTVIAELANGKNIVARNAWTVEVQEVKTEEGTFDVRWEAMSVEEA